MYLANVDFDALIREDVPYFDLTGFELGLDHQPARIACFTREDCIACGTEEAREIFRRLSIETKEMVDSGTKISAGTELIVGIGEAVNVITAWKVIQNLLDHMSGVATSAGKLVDVVRKINPDISVLTTRKMFSGTRALMIKSIMAGGALPHRLGTSETVLVFSQHINLLGGQDAFIKRLPALKKSCCEKKILVETSDLELARRYCMAGADGIQIEKLPPEQLVPFCHDLKQEFPHIMLLAAGGINPSNAVQYAKAEIEGIVTTSLYHAKPVDMGVRIVPAE